jgi:DNA adenine methylase
MHEQIPLLSPLRYPGGKNWLRKIALSWLRNLPANPNIFIDPFGGGASVSFAVAHSKTVPRILISELDPDVAALWKTIFGENWKMLTERIESLLLLRADVKKLLKVETGDEVDKAFRCLLRNRVQHGGVIAPGANLLQNGEANRGIASRWYPETLVDRITKLHEMRHQIEFIECDGMKLINQFRNSRRAAFFVDPPYLADGVGPGRRLYRHSDIVPEDIFQALSRVRGHFLLCYHDAPAIRNLVREFGLRYRTISMRNTHHEDCRELLITKPQILAD